MTPDTHDGSQWDRVAAELRACRETQQRAWGDIDNTTLGRFLAGEVTSEEQQQIENALDALPELRKLTDLVRDVLSEADTAAPEPVSVPYGPMVLPFPQPQQRTMKPARTSPRAEPTAPSRQSKPWYREDRWRQRIGLAAAACLLLVLGVTLPRTTGSAQPEAGQSLALTAPVADSTPPFDAPGGVMPRAIAANHPMQLRKGADRDEPQHDKRLLLRRMDDSLQHLEAQGKKPEADLLARQYVNNLTRQAYLYREKGDLARAEPVLHEACHLCDKAFGPEAPQTVRTRKSLAGVYEVALNSAPSLPQTPGGTPKLHVSVQPATSSTLPIHSASGYAAPQSPPTALDGSRREYQPRYGAPPLVEHSPSSRPAEFVLRERIIHRSPKEVKASVVPVLTQALREAKDVHERQRFARALSQLGPVAGDAAPLLLGLCRGSTDAAERSTLLLALARIGPKELRQTLEPYLRRNDYEGGVQACLRFLANAQSEPRP
jgi:hypothetical protein